MRDDSDEDDVMAAAAKLSTMNLSVALFCFFVERLHRTLRWFILDVLAQNNCIN